MHKFALGGEFLDKRCDGRPEHPESGGDQRVHQVEFPDFRSAEEGQNGNRQDDDGACGIEHHDQPAAVLAINDNAGERQHEHGGDCHNHR